MFRTIYAAALAAVLFTVPVSAQQAATPDGVWKDKWGTTFTFSLCGDGTQLCGVLNDIQGDSRTAENLAYVNQEVVRANRVAPGKWEGSLSLNGGQAKAIVTLVSPNTIELTGCKAMIFCQSIPYQRQ